jgi:hypothetical protein
MLPDLNSCQPVALTAVNAAEPMPSDRRGSRAEPTYQNHLLRKELRKRERMGAGPGLEVQRLRRAPFTLRRRHTVFTNPLHRTRRGNLGIGGFCAVALCSGLVFISVFKLGLLDSPSQPEEPAASAPKPNGIPPQPGPSLFSETPSSDTPAAAASTPGIRQPNRFNANGIPSAAYAGGQGGFRSPSAPPAPSPADCPSCEQRRKR